MIKKFFNSSKGFTRTPKSLVSGFTILESIVAIAILSVSVSGAFSAVSQSFAQANIARDEIRAFYLAQEAIEIIRNKRDVNQLIKMGVNPTNSWLEGITQGAGNICSFGSTCTVDATNFQIFNCGSGWGSCTQNLRQDPNTFLYSYDNTDPATNFKREIQIESVNGNTDEIAVIVRVSWTKGLTTREFKVKAHLFNWI